MRFLQRTGKGEEMATRRIGRGTGRRDGSGRGVRANRNTGGCRKVAQGMVVAADGVMGLEG